MSVLSPVEKEILRLKNISVLANSVYLKIRDKIDRNNEIFNQLTKLESLISDRVNEVSADYLAKLQEEQPDLKAFIEKNYTAIIREIKFLAFKDYAKSFLQSPEIEE